MHSERTKQGLTEKPAPREAGFEICFECTKNVFNLRIWHSPLVNEFHIASCVIVRKRLLQHAWFEIEKDPFHRLRERDRVLGTS
jgi:hypothetical protein